ncbi:hypothetical protein B5S28_g2452 [[Candida] boidinii]|nr:hypothetical protein B5S28_g2452 [[Candida] boidinii]OWB62548.1 hypothetical protein B5S29_g3481 [[Candida] boidinii]OWB73253.1 hypothetical protein B5S31_g2987 [[Candida] boidinii]
MKLTSSFCILGLASIESVYAFKDAAPIFMKLSQDLQQKPLSYVTHFKDDLSNTINSLYGNICNNNNNDNNDLIVLQIPGLKKEDFGSSSALNLKSYISQNINDMIYSPHVHYEQDEILLINNELLLNNNENCNIKIQKIEDLSDNSWINNNENSNNKVTVLQLPSIDVADRESAISKLDSFFNKIWISSTEELSNVIIQGLPTFEERKHKSLLKKASKWLNPNEKRESSEEEDDEEESYAQVEAELKSAFEEINEMIGDEVVTMYNDEVPSSQVKKADSSSTATNGGSLLDNYGFFSTGIWMGTIVSLLLVFIFSVSLSWISSLNISYKSFDKPMNLQKKTQ